MLTTTDAFLFYTYISYAALTDIWGMCNVGNLHIPLVAEDPTFNRDKVWTLKNQFKYTS